MSPRRTRHAVVAFVVCAGVVVLTGCQAVHRTALRLNEDGSFDFGTCHALDDVSGGTADAYLRENDFHAGVADLPTGDLPEHLAAGDVIHIPTPATDDWDRLEIIIEGEYTTRAGETIASTVEGLFKRNDLEVGEWSWARSGIFIGTIPVEACELNG